MKSLAAFSLAVALGLGGAVAPAIAQPSKSDQIEKRVLPSMGGAEYLGPAYDSTAMAYRLKFIRDGRVMYVDVDARTGRILRRSR